MRGKTEKGIPWTQRASGYPAELPTLWGKEICANVDWERKEMLQEEVLPTFAGEMKQKSSGSGKKRSPPCSYRWGKAGRWRRVAQV